MRNTRTAVNRQSVARANRSLNHNTTNYRGTTNYSGATSYRGTTNYSSATNYRGTTNNKNNTNYNRGTYNSGRSQYNNRGFQGYGSPMGSSAMSRGYIDNNARYNASSEAFDYSTEIREPRPIKKKKQGVAFAMVREVAPLSLLKTFGTIALIFVMVLANLIVFATNSSKRDQIVSSQDTLATMQEENMFLENSIEESLDLNKIENEAMKLGLQKPAEYQVMYINVPKESYTVQYNPTDAHKSYASIVWSKVVKIFEG